MSTHKVIGIGILVILVGGWFALSQQESGDAMMEQEKAAMQKDEDSAMQKEEPVMEKKDDAMMEKKDSGTMETSGEMMQAGSYEAYSPEKLALATKGDVLLFFHANWCPVCRGLESEIQANLSSISDGVHILKVDYDTAIALRQKYGVTVQHTFVQVDAQGTSLQKFNDASTLTSVLARVQ